MPYASRKAQKEDFARIGKFPANAEEAFFMYPSGVYPLTGEQLEEAAAKRFHPTVVLHDGELAGYANFYATNEGTQFWLGNFIVAPAFRSKGAGAFLLTTMMEIAKRDLGMSRLQLVCHGINTKAMLFYLKMGFQPFEMFAAKDHEGRPIVSFKLAAAL
ncbi:GNAT family N-acetyltransferase [Paenibacillus cymbidii]|uniref:GNAT family N-acetyltransferase n=1 Tax=Paenibacillus cymbidii TaxID=1639034 RepID=UPI00108025BB|nr:GNAT family N-acetyltransferase [Paenibacillus cymbidii]